ncbi:MAG: hypothetical protein ACOVS5_08985 [Oligoflexus sp.]|jgi:hypothetical protein
MQFKWSYPIILYPIALFAFIIGLKHQPILDLPNHTARQFIMSSLLFDASSPFQNWFRVEWVPKPYIFNDLLAVSLLQLASPTLVANLMLYLAFILLPLSVTVYLRAIDQPWPKILLCLPFLFYLATNRYLTIGFTHFLTSLGIGFLLLAVAEKNLLHIQKPSLKWMTTYFLGTVILYLTHSYGLAVFAIMLCIRLMWERPLTLRFLVVGTYLSALPPILVLFQKLVWPDSLDTFWVYFAPRSELLDRFFEPFHRFHRPSDMMFGIAHLFLILCFYLLITRKDPERVANKHVRFQLASFGTFLLLFLCLPVGFMKAWDIDTRALLPAMVFLVVAAVPRTIHSNPNQLGQVRFLHLAAVLLMLVQGLYVSYHLSRADQRLTKLMEIMSLIPAEKNVFLVDADSARFDPSPHHLSLYVIEKKGNIPTLFSAETGAPFSYFHIDRDRILPEAPSKWYMEGKYQSVLEILDQFDYMLANRPLNLPNEFASRVKLMKQTDGGALYAIIK